MTAVRHKASAYLTLSQIVRPTTMQFLHVYLLVFGCRQIIPRAQRVSVRFGAQFRTWTPAVAMSVLRSKLALTRSLSA